jgi:uncharacterized protein YndB with AHSA1/START domain
VSPPAGDAATVTVFVAVAVEEAFDVFTNEIDQWWRHGPKFRNAAMSPGRLVIVGGAGGRLYESFERKSGPRTVEVGRVLAWDPPHHFSMEWRVANFAPHEKTLVEVSFRPSGEGTLVTVRHSGWSTIRDDHPARHGKVGADLSRMIGLWWGDLMSALREHVLTRTK